MRFTIAELLLLVIAGAWIALAAGCAGVQTVEVPKIVKVPSPVPCVDPVAVPARPTFYTELELEQLDDYRWTLAVAADRQRAIDYAGELEPIVAGCSRIPAPAAAKDSQGKH